MNIDELYGLTKWVKREIAGIQVPQKYQQLHAVLQQNSQPNQQKTSFESQKDELLIALKGIHTASLSKDQVIFLEKLGIAPMIGMDGINLIEDTLFRNGLDIATAATKIAEYNQTLTEGIRKANLIEEGLNGYVEIDHEEDLDGVLMRVCFLNDASMANVVDFKKWGKVWHDIGRGVAQVHDEAPESIKIIGATKGSVIIEMVTDPTIAITVSAIILGALKVSEKVLEVKKKAAEIRILNLQEKKLSAEMEKAAEKEKEAGIQSIADKQVIVLRLDKNNDGDKIVALKKAIEDLTNFIENGGEVDFIAPEEEVDDEGEIIEDDFTLVREQAVNIRQLENHIKLLENNSKKDEDDA